MSIVLSCPSCTTRYRADPQAIGQNGRRVRCASCGHVWTAEADHSAELPELQAAPAETVDETPEPAAEDVAPHTAYRERVARKRHKMSLAMAGGAWGSLAAAFLILFAASWIYRVDIVTLWPRAASAYAAVGAEVNPFGIAVGELTVTQESEHGVPLLIVEGSLKNYDRRRRDLPQVRAVLFDAGDEALLEWAVPVEGGYVRAGERREFRSVISDPPPDTAEIEVLLVAAEARAGDEHEAGHSEDDAEQNQAVDHASSAGHGEPADDTHP